MDPTDQTSFLTSFLAMAAPILAALGAFLCGAAVTALWVMSRRRQDGEEPESPPRSRRDPRRRNEPSAAPKPRRATPAFDEEAAEEAPEPVQPRPAGPSPASPAPVGQAPAGQAPGGHAPAAVPSPEDEATTAADAALERRLEAFEKELQELHELLQLPPEEQDPGIFEYMAGSTAVTLEMLKAARQAHAAAPAPAARPKPGPRPVVAVVESEPEPSEAAVFVEPEEADTDAPEPGDSSRPPKQSRRDGLFAREEPPPLRDEPRLDGEPDEIAEPSPPPRRRRRGAAPEPDPDEAPLPRGNRARALLRGDKD